MSYRHTGRGLLRTAALVAVVVPMALTGHSTAVTAAGTGYAASDVFGQVDGSGNPVFTTNAQDNGASTPNPKGFAYPQGTALDAAGHRLFVAECSNHRVMVYNLDTSNNVISHSATNVLGQANFLSNGPQTTQSTMRCPVGPSYDPVHKRLFVVDSNNNRVLVYDLSSGITNGMNATWVLGEPDFTTVSPVNNCPATQSTMCRPYGGSAYDPVHDRFFVSDGQNMRVLVYDLAAGITNGMNATAELGQPNFTGKTCGRTSTLLGYPYGLALDARRQLLYVADDGNCSTVHSARVMVWDLSNGITSGMQAAHVLGQPNFTAGAPNLDNKAATDSPEDLALDPVGQRLFVQDDIRNRVLVFDVAAITDGEEASAVIGQPDFLTQSSNQACPPTSKYNQCDAEGQSEAFDVTNHRLYLSDSSDNRVLVFNFVRITTTLLPSGSFASGTGYSATIQSVNAQGAVSYALASGSLPPGLTLDAATGKISGTPTTDGTYNFSVRATDDNGAVGFFTDVHAESIIIAGIPVPASGGAAG